MTGIFNPILITLYRIGWYVCCAVVCGAATDCSQFIDGNLPEPVRSTREPELGRAYQLYRPSWYDASQSWPLIVVCHGGFPDSPKRRIQAWTELAEEYGFLIAAPKLTSAPSLRKPKAKAQRERQIRDEAVILSVVRHMRAGHNISDDRVFLHGWSSGAFVALYTGLRHPEIFRAVALAKPRFQLEFVEGVADRLDRHQPIFVHFAIDDTLTGNNGQRCCEWLRSIGADLIEEPIGPVDSTNTKPYVEFFQETVRTNPWVRIRALPAAGGGPLAVQFKLRSSYVPTRYRWEFGDGTESTAAQPSHGYAAAGTYSVTLTVDGPHDVDRKRVVQVKVPEVVLRTSE